KEAGVRCEGVKSRIRYKKRIGLVGRAKIKQSNAVALARDQPAPVRAKVKAGILGTVTDEAASRRLVRRRGDGANRDLPALVIRDQPSAVRSEGHFANMTPDGPEPAACDPA